MATITTIQSTDLITDSRADINTNFSNLNTDKIETSYLDTDTALTANSDTKIATQKAVKAYVDAGGNVNASETTKGIVEEATDSEVTAGTATGATGAKLFVTPAKLATYQLSIAGVLKSSGADGALTIASGATNVDLGGQSVVVKNYTSISITGTGQLTFTNPHANGTTILLLCNSFVATSSTSPNIDASSLGAAGGSARTRAVAGGGGTQTDNGNAGTAGVSVSNHTSNFGAAGVGNTTGALGGGVPTLRAFGQTLSQYLNGLFPWSLVGAGGGSGGLRWLNGAASQTISTGAGGRGGGSLIIVSSGAWNFTGTMSVAGGGGVAPSVPNMSGQAMAGGGGGGGGGTFIGLYRTLTANSGTVTSSGGTGGNSVGDNASGNTAAGGGGGASASAGSSGTVAGNASKSGADGGAGLSVIEKLY